MVQIFTAVKNTFVNADVDSPDCTKVGSNARRAESSALALMTIDAAESEKHHAHAFKAKGLQLFPLQPHDDDNSAFMHAHPGPSPLDLDVEGMLGVRVSETDIDEQFWGLSDSLQMYEITPDFVNLGMDIDDTVSEETEDHNASALAYHGLTYGAQNPSCVSTAPSTPHEPARRHLSSASTIPTREEQRDSHRQSDSGSTRARVRCRAKHKEMQGEEKRTTVMLRNVPLGYTNSKLMHTIELEGFASMYDFIYVPMVATRTSKGYAFVNLVSPSIAQRFLSAFNGFSRWSTASKNTCHATWATDYQGLQSNIDHYRNSSVLGESVPDEYKPRIFQNGEEIPFPPPNRKPSIDTRRCRRSRNKTKGSRAPAL